MEIITWLLTSLAFVLGLIWLGVDSPPDRCAHRRHYWLKYGWQRAPYEVWKRTRSFGWFFWSWIRGRDPNAELDRDGSGFFITYSEPRAHDEVRLVRRREFGDVNISTLLSIAVLGGLLLVAPL